MMSKTSETDTVHTDENGRSYREVKHPSVMPCYLIAASWIFFAWKFPLYRIKHFIVFALITLAEAWLFRKICKPTVEKVYIPYTVPHTGIDDTDTALETGASYIRKFDTMIPELAAIDNGLAVRLTEIRDLMKGMFDYITAHPDKISKFRRFINFYLPTLEKLVNTYLELSAQKIKGENIQRTLREIENTLNTVKPSFENILNDLYQDKAIDISSDITVLENLLETDDFGKS